MVHPHLLNDALSSGELWVEALEKYAQTTHLTIKLFDTGARLVLGPIHPTSLFQACETQGYDPGLFIECAHRCLEQADTRPAIMVSQVHGLAVVGTSLMLDGTILGAAVGGYVLLDFSQVSEIQCLAHNSGITFESLWNIARKKAPVSKQRLRLHGELLQVLGDTLLQEHYRRHQYEQAATIIQHSDDAIITNDFNGLISSWNYGATRLFGYTDQEIVGHSIMKLIPSDRQVEERSFLDRIRQGKTIEHYETVRSRKDGTRLDISLTMSPIINARGENIGASSIARDVTGRKRAEERLRASESRYRNLFESIDEGFCVIQVVIANNKVIDFIFLESNPAFERRLGIVAAPGSSMRAAALNLSDQWFDMCGQVALTGESMRFEYHAAELHRWYEVYAYRLGQAHERKVATLFNDITARKQTESQLRHFNNDLEKRVQERTAELTQSQDRLRNLATQLTLTEQRERQHLATELHDHLQQLVVLAKLKMGQGKRLAEPLPACMEMLGQVDQLLTESLAYTRTLVTELSPPVLREYGLIAALRWLAKYMKRHDLTVAVQVPELGDVKLPHDHAVLVFQSVRELLINVSKHAGTGEATITVTPRDGELRIEVRDQGTGFDLGVFTAASSTQSGNSSTFGLFSIYERMSALGGSFNVCSATGKGTTAILLLPLLRAETNQLRPEPANLKPSTPQFALRSFMQSSSLSPPPSPHNIRVLLVDDHAMVRQGLRSILEWYTDVEIVGEASDGEEAIACVARYQPAVVLMDINMPKKNGIEATAEIMAHWPRTTVIGLSVNAADDNQVAMARAGAALLLTKEAAVEELYRAMQQVLQSTAQN